jgi:hypothetical protein
MNNDQKNGCAGTLPRGGERRMEALQKNQLSRAQGSRQKKFNLAVVFRTALDMRGER